MKKDIIEKIQADGLIFDGAMGTMLIENGLTGGESSESWNLSHPETIQSVHQAYFDAGADVATANTFGASAFKLKTMGVEHSVQEINQAAVKLAKAAAGPEHYVGGDIGPLGEMMAPLGTMTREQAVEIYTEQAGILADAGVDFFIIETMFDLNEALAALSAVKTVSSKPIFSSMTFQNTEMGFFTLMGSSVADCMQELSGAGASVVGANCSMGSDTMTKLAEEIVNSVDVPVLIQPNAGLPEDQPDGSICYPESVDFFVHNIKVAKAKGVDVVGGCCGSKPEFIQRLCQECK